MFLTITKKFRLFIDKIIMYQLIIKKTRNISMSPYDLKQKPHMLYESYLNRIILIFLLLPPNIGCSIALLANK